MLREFTVCARFVSQSLSSLFALRISNSTPAALLRRSALGSCGLSLTALASSCRCVQNRVKALKVLRSRLYEASRQAESDRRNKLRSEQLGSGDRSEKIRTYNFPQSRITDHRINLTVFGIEKMMRGELLTDLSEQLMKNDVRVQLHNM